MSIETLATTGSLRVGDVITFSYCPPRWKRIWYAIRYMRHNNPLHQPPRQFVVSWGTASSYELEQFDE